MHLTASVAKIDKDMHASLQHQPMRSNAAEDHFHTTACAGHATDALRIRTVAKGANLRCSYWLAALIISTGLSAALAAGGAVYTRAMFMAGLKEGGFVLIKLAERSEKTQQSVSVPANLLLGAIHMQYGLDYDDAGNAHAMEIALAAKDRTFRFTKKAAYENVKPAYTREQLAEVRKKLSRLTPAELRRQLHDPYGEIHGIYARPSGQSYHDAVAHVLLESGIPVMADNRTDMLMPLEGNHATH